MLMNHDYWHIQDPHTPLFPDIEWSKPEQRALRGRLGIIGGNKLGFAAIADSYSTALATGSGEVRVVLPDSLRNVIPKTMTDVIYAASNPSGGIVQAALPELYALTHWATGILMIGDTGRNSETAITYSALIRDYQGPLTITRDAIDLVKNDAPTIIGRPNTILIASFAQLQKIFRETYYPKMLTFSMQLLQLVEAVHAFTITYPCTITVLHRDTLIVAHNGTVVTTAWDNPLAIWKGTTATRAATYLMWTPSQPLEAIATSLITHAST